MKKLITLLAAAFSVSVATADLVMIQETAVGEVRSKTVISIKGGKVRTDSGTETSVIIDTATGMMTTLVHEQKMVIKTDTAELSKAAAAPLPGGKKAEDFQSKLTATGQKETVQGHECEIYIMENMGTKTKMWIAKDYPGYDKLKTAMAPLYKMSFGASKAPEPPGVTIKYEYEQQNLKFVTSLVSIKEQEVDASLFEAPAGYKAPGA